MHTPKYGKVVSVTPFVRQDLTSTGEIDFCLAEPLQDDSEATEEQISRVAGIMSLFSSILRSSKSQDPFTPAAFLKVLLLDRYFEVLIETFNLFKVHDTRKRQVLNEHLEEFRHCFHVQSEETEQLLHRR